MSRREEFFDQVRQDRVLAIVRADTDLVPTVQALWRGGIRLVEIALTSDAALGAIASLAATGAVGAGTVRNQADAERALEAGASFLVSPDTDAVLVEWAVENDVPHLPGVFTATEIEAARRLGAGPLKLFPASVGGPDYVAALLAPFPELELVPTGGVSIANAGAYLARGATAVAVGGALTGAGDVLGVEHAAQRLLVSVERC